MEVAKPQNLQDIQEQYLKNGQTILLDFVETFQGKQIDWDNLDKLEDDLGFLYERVKELNGNA